MVPLPHIHICKQEWIKPAIPTSKENGKLPLSDWDVVMYKSYIPLLLFYPNFNKSADFMETSFLLHSLRQVLVDFYPLAGRLIDIGNGRDEIHCNDTGVLFQVSNIK